MAQIKIYGLREHLKPIQTRLSETVHRCVVEAFALPPDKKFQRFFALENDDFVFPADKSARYLIIEISCFEGRSVETKKALLRLLFVQIGAEFGLAPHDLEITIFETPRANWGIRGLPADEIGLNYKIDV